MKATLFRVYLRPTALAQCVTIYLFSAPYKIGFAQNGIFWLVDGDFCQNSRGFHLAYGKLNQDQHKKREILAQNAKNGSKNRSINPEIGVAENRYIR